MKNKKIVFLIILSILLILLFIFVINNLKSGNNNIKSADKIKQYILNISSYETIATITVNSNKNTNTYKIKQQYIDKKKIYKQEVIEPNSIKGISTYYDGTNLTVKNSKLNISMIYKEYPFLIDNDLDLITFIKDYINNEESFFIKIDNEVILTTKKRDNNIDKVLYIDANTKNIKKMVIKNKTQKTSINIEYNEIKINSLQQEEIFAFRITETTKNDI